MKHLILSLLQTICRNLDYQGACRDQYLSLSKDAFGDLKAFALKYDEETSRPNALLDMWFPDHTPSPIYPDLIKTEPQIKAGGYIFKIKIQ